ncbi:unnamed protein product [Prorocentrum cordatum]|uniref:Uncharacterized protein n=1 Tax=Prorocentrum cordatum TaxID=2364126 RepID=A0ABN9VCS4_9DINO|nr:unnamed protein product [Polarella glacialis]
MSSRKMSGISVGSYADQSSKRLAGNSVISGGRSYGLTFLKMTADRQESISTAIDFMGVTFGFWTHAALKNVTDGTIAPRPRPPADDAGDAADSPAEEARLELPGLRWSRIRASRPRGHSGAGQPAVQPGSAAGPAGAQGGAAAPSEHAGAAGDPGKAQADVAGAADELVDLIPGQRRKEKFMSLSSTAMGGFVSRIRSCLWVAPSAM